MIIPVYNGEKYIEEALESVFAQTFQDFEVIVINDGSTDGTEQRLAKYFPRIRYLLQDNQGQSASRKVGLELAEGLLIAFLDADDAWLPKKLERQVEFAQTHPEYGIVTTDQLSFRDNEVVCPSYKTIFKITNGFILERILFGHWISTSAALIRRECFDKVVFYSSEPPEFAEDWMMWMQIAAYYPIYFIDEVLVRRRLHAGNVSYQKEEAQFQCLLRNLEILREKIPRLKARPRVIDEAAFRICFSRGVTDLRAVELPRARERLQRAVSYKPHAIKAWAALCATYIPAGVLYGLKKVMGRRKPPSAASKGGSRK